LMCQVFFYMFDVRAVLFYSFFMLRGTILDDSVFVV